MGRSILKENIGMNWGSFMGLQFFLLFMVLVLAGCNPDEQDEPGDSFDREAFLINAADNLIIPAYSEAVVSAENLCIALWDGTLEQSRAALKECAMKWQAVALFDFGPAVGRNLLGTTNSHPCDSLDVDEDVMNGNVVPGLPSTLDRTGLPALDYLLHKGEWNADRLQHATFLANHLHDELQAVHDSWVTEYRDDFVSRTDTDIGSGLGMMLNAFNRTYEGNVRKGKLGLPAGVFSFSGNPAPQLAEAYHAGDWSVDLLQEAMLATERIYLGGEGIGLDDYLQSLGDVSYGTELDAEIKAQIAAAQAAVLTLDDPLSEYVVSNQPAALDVYSELQALVILLKVDMMSALGVLVTYQDTDGD
ncbi:MAG: hypothetical protein CL828_00435 [Crocinitomicaceae bacterium]|nr:hypothetical protein [Crocinitomicaceae bacterium]